MSSFIIQIPLVDFIEEGVISFKLFCNLFEERYHDYAEINMSLYNIRGEDDLFIYDVSVLLRDIIFW